MEEAAWLKQTVSTKVSDAKGGSMYSSLHPVRRQGTTKSPQKRNVLSRRMEAAAKTMKQEFEAGSLLRSRQPGIHIKIG